MIKVASQGQPGRAGAAGAQGAKGDTGLTGATGQAGAASTVPGPQGQAGATGAAGLGTVAPTTPARALNTVFQPSAIKATYCSYSAALSVTNPLLAGTSTASVQLLSDAANPPTTVRATAAIGSGVGLAVSIALTTTNTIPLDYIVPAGHYVKLASATSGTGSVALSSQTEETLG